jgi:hypothetical protein
LGWALKGISMVLEWPFVASLLIVLAWATLTILGGVLRLSMKFFSWLHADPLFIEDLRYSVPDPTKPEADEKTR